MTVQIRIKLPGKPRGSGHKGPGTDGRGRTPVPGRTGDGLRVKMVHVVDLPRVTATEGAQNPVIDAGTGHLVSGQTDGSTEVIGKTAINRRTGGTEGLMTETGGGPMTAAMTGSKDDPTAGPEGGLKATGKIKETALRAARTGVTAGPITVTETITGKVIGIATVVAISTVIVVTIGLTGDRRAIVVIAGTAVPTVAVMTDVIIAVTIGATTAVVIAVKAIALIGVVIAVVIAGMTGAMTVGTVVMTTGRVTAVAKTTTAQASGLMTGQTAQTADMATEMTTAVMIAVIAVPTVAVMIAGMTDLMIGVTIAVMAAQTIEEMMIADKMIGATTGGMIGGMIVLVPAVVADRPKGGAVMSMA